MIRFLSMVRVQILKHTRSPLLLVGLLLFSVVVASLPEVPEAGVPRIRGLAAFHIGAGGLLLGIAALVLPLASMRARRRGLRGGASRFAIQASAMAAHGLTLIVLACLLAFASLVLVSLREGWPDGRREEPVLRRRLAAEPAERVDLGPARPDASWSLAFPHEGWGGGPAVEGRRLRLRLRPRLVMGLREDGGPATANGYPMQVAWRFSPRARWRSKTFELGRGRRPQLVLPVPAGVREGSIEVRVSRPGRGYGIRLEPESVILLGASAPFYASILRSYTLAALAAIGLMGVATWLTGFTGAAIAIAATLTVALVSAAVHPWVPGVPLEDAGRRLGEGVGLAWRDLGPTALKALLVLAIATLLPFRDRRLEGVA